MIGHENNYVKDQGYMADSSLPCPQKKSRIQAKVMASKSSVRQVLINYLMCETCGQSNLCALARWRVKAFAEGEKYF